MVAAGWLVNGAKHSGAPATWVRDKAWWKPTICPPRIRILDSRKNRFPQKTEPTKNRAAPVRKRPGRQVWQSAP